MTCMRDRMGAGMLVVLLAVATQRMWAALKNTPGRLSSSNCVALSSSSNACNGPKVSNLGSPPPLSNSSSIRIGLATAGLPGWPNAKALNTAPGDELDQ